MRADNDDTIASGRTPEETPRAAVLDELMTAKQIAELLQVPTSTVEDYARRELLPSLKLGRHRRFIRSEIEHAITQLLDQRHPHPYRPRPSRRSSGPYRSAGTRPPRAERTSRSDDGPARREHDESVTQAGASG